MGLVDVVTVGEVTDVAVTLAEASCEDEEVVVTGVGFVSEPVLGARPSLVCLLVEMGDVLDTETVLVAGLRFVFAAEIVLLVVLADVLVGVKTLLVGLGEVLVDAGIALLVGLTDAETVVFAVLADVETVLPAGLGDVLSVDTVLVAGLGDVLADAEIVLRFSTCRKELPSPAAS